MKALLIIDMQKGCFLPYSSRHDVLDIISRINMLSAKFRKEQYPVIFIRHDGTSENELIPQTDDWALLPELTQVSTDLYIDKTANDAFYQSGLQQALTARGIDELYITGAATDFCVDATVKSAFSKDYKVTIISDCHTTEDKTNFPAQSLVAHYNWVWSAMAPTKQKISVVHASAVEL
jgi:nicotinamidase-related amidase